MERADLKSLVRATGCAVERNGAVFLIDSQASADERAQADALMAQPSAAAGDAGWLCIRTGGTGGVVKFARHDEATLRAAATGLVQHFGLARVNAIDVLPAYHVSGLMARVRCAATGGRHLAWDAKRLVAGERPELAAGEWVISLVPTQLQRLLQSPAATDWLRRLAIIFVGGGPLWPDLAESAAGARLRLSPSYGLTETAAMVAAVRPEEFLAGDRSSGTALPHARLDLTADGVVRVTAASVFHGYWPAWDATRGFVTEDLGRIDERGRLHVLGRRDAMILTGGKKVQPEEVEAALRASGEFTDVAVIGVPDAEWGEAVVACYPANSARVPDLDRAVAALAGYQRPKRFVPLVHWPRTEQGKVNRGEVKRAVSDQRSAVSDSPNRTQHG